MKFRVLFSIQQTLSNNVVRVSVKFIVKFKSILIYYTKKVRSLAIQLNLCNWFPFTDYNIQKFAWRYSKIMWVLFWPQCVNVKIYNQMACHPNVWNPVIVADDQIGDKWQGVRHTRVTDQSEIHFSMICQLLWHFSYAVTVLWCGLLFDAAE